MQKKAVCYGEMLWDILPAEKAAGGAPMNVAVRLQSLGVPAKTISRIGIDELGRSLLEILKSKSVDTSLVQSDSTLETGQVHVTLTADGIPAYNIVYPAAWDKIEFTELISNAVKECDLFIFGSLICRDDVSKNTLMQLLDFAKYKVFDINLRKPFYAISLVEELMQKADFIKLNDEELYLITKEFGSVCNGIEENVEYLAEKMPGKVICVTLGAEGALIYADMKFYRHPGYKVKVADTIGAGDSFLAALLSKLLNGADYNDALSFACAVGALVASHKGANPDISEQLTDFYR